MKSDSEFWREDLPESQPQFDEDAAQQILRRAAEEEVRRESDAADSYTLEQLQEIASQAGISPEAVRAAAREHQAVGGRAPSGTRTVEGGEAGGWLAALKRRMPASWSPRLKNAVLVVAGVALFGVVISLVGVGPVVGTLSLSLVLLLLLLLLGLGPV